ncbi:hypothetical protein [Glaciimonas sp. PCH181]|uniref:hypothetical protein n=1 Tax=Glaciimonas sp. PCH181 TaxID=2133943 RepID=UPI000D3674C2|nr:hypothetical protein [Glaciimonas sp. PCH181]PUA17331.1 hypothetical protein C7W93_15510 [Glaciimonas sp. PCH181]
MLQVKNAVSTLKDEWNVLEAQHKWFVSKIDELKDQSDLATDLVRSVFVKEILSISSRMEEASTKLEFEVTKIEQKAEFHENLLNDIAASDAVSTELERLSKEFHDAKENFNALVEPSENDISTYQEKIKLFREITKKSKILKPIILAMELYQSIEEGDELKGIEIMKSPSFGLQIVKQLVEFVRMDEQHRNVDFAELLKIRGKLENIKSGWKNRHTNTDQSRFIAMIKEKNIIIHSVKELIALNEVKNFHTKGRYKIDDYNPITLSNWYHKAMPHVKFHIGAPKQK